MNDIEFDSDVLFGFTKSDLKEDHAILDIKIRIPISKRSDAFDFLKKVKTFVTNGLSEDKK